MFAKAYFPHQLPPELLDDYLLRGWFRMGQTVFTTNFLHFQQQLHSAVWLRIDLDLFRSTRRLEKIRRLNEGFRVEFGKARVDLPKERLFAKYRQHVSFEASASLNQLMYGASSGDVFNTWEVSVFDGDRLIAAGFFDVGKVSAAGITSFYDPDYKKFSLGKYLIFLKINFCQRKGHRYFYPGYFVPGNSFFDYKLEFCLPAIQFLDLVSSAWLPAENFSPSYDYFQVMKSKLHELQEALAAAEIHVQLYAYEYFDANVLVDADSSGLFDFPLFLSRAGAPQVNPVVYDVRDQMYHVYFCSALRITDAGASQPGVFNTHLLRVESDGFRSPQPQEVVAILKGRNSS